MSKSIFKSKVFWFNVVTCGAHFLGYLPADIAGIVVPIVNVVLRYVTTEPVSVLPA